MRMDQRRPVTAEHIIATAKEEELAEIFFITVMKSRPGRIAGRIVRERKVGRIVTTGQLATVVEAGGAAPLSPPENPRGHPSVSGASYRC